MHNSGNISNQNENYHDLPDLQICNQEVNTKKDIKHNMLDQIP